MNNFEIGGSHNSPGIPPEHNPQPFHEPAPQPVADTPPYPGPEPQVVYVDRIVEKIVEKKRSVVGYWIAIILLAILFIIFALASLGLVVINSDLEDTIAYQETEIGDLQHEILEKDYDYKELQSTMASLTDRIKSSFPLIISDIEIGNVTYDNDILTDYGKSIYASQACFLKPKVKYYGMVDGSRMLKTKWIRPDGTVISGNSSPSGFSQSDSFTIVSGPNQSLLMGGWGWKEPGNWTAGTYRIEIWYGNTCLQSKTFQIYY